MRQPDDEWKRSHLRMSVKLDWDFENEPRKRENYREDRRGQRARRARYARIVLGVAILLALCAGVGTAVYLRFQQVDARIEALLRDTVQAEVAALRIGNFEEYLNLQRSATNDWVNAQAEMFRNYQTLKAYEDVTLTGRIEDIAIENQRGRVVVEEIIGGVPYWRVWFYWRYEDGWRHVPPDYTFWGAAAAQTVGSVTVNYRAMDARLAQMLAEELNAWATFSCEVVACAQIPAITVDVVTDPLPQAEWVRDDPNDWHLRVPTPLRGRARADVPMDTVMRLELATLLAERVVQASSSTNAIQPLSDAAFLQNGVMNWFVEEFIGTETEAELVDSLVTNYGRETVPKLLNTLQPEVRIGILSSVTGVTPLSALTVDWSDFVLWRLQAEQVLIVQGDLTRWEGLYDFAVPGVRGIAYERYNTQNQMEIAYSVLEVAQGAAPDGVPTLNAVVQRNNGFDVQQMNVTFRLMDGTWLRAD